MHVIVIIFDNTDPAVYGPYDSEAEANLCLPGVRKDLQRAGVADHHIESIVVRKLRGGAL